MKQKGKKDWLEPSIGSDESGNGGLFGGAAFAAFRLSEENRRIILGQKWYGFLNSVRDPKMMDKDAVILLAQKIKNLFVENKDYLILDISSERYNELLTECEKEPKKEKKMDSSEILLNKMHSKMYERLITRTREEPLPRRVDDYRDKRGLSIVEKDPKFTERGELIHLSISIAAILATDTYLRQLQGIREELSVNIRNRHNHNLSPQRLKDVFIPLEKSGLSRDHIYSRYCKRDRLKIYKSNLKNQQKQNPQ